MYFAREYGLTPEQTIGLPFHHRRVLIEGLNGVYDLEPESGSSGASRIPEDDYRRDPRFPRASRGDVMASPEELMALGIQYSRE